MSQDVDPEREPQAGDAPHDGPPPPPPTPLDHPLFLPILLFAGCIWFGYDGWFNPEIKSVRFNQITFVILVILTVWYGRQGIQEFLEDREKERADSDPPDA